MLQEGAQGATMKGVTIPLLPIGLVGAATLLFEILLTRIFSVTMWYHFAFVAISLALFGISASGVAVGLAPALARVDRALGISAFAFGVAIPVSFLVDQRIPFLPFDVAAGPGLRGSLQPYALFFLKFVVLSLPFFFSGLTIALAFLHSPTRSTHVYFGDLVGAGVGCCLVVPLLLAYSAPSGIFFSAALPFAAAALFFVRSGRRKSAVAAILGVCLAIGGAATNERRGFASIVRVKSYEREVGTEVERPKIYERWHPVSRVAVHPLEVSTTNADWFYGRPAEMELPGMLEVTNDAGARTHIYPRLSPEEYGRIFRLDLSDLVYSMIERPAVLVIGVGGGKDILAALSLGAKQVTGVELNPLMIDVVQERFGSFSGRPFDDPRVRIVIDEGRNFIASRPDRYDVIKISGTDTWAASAAGAYALTESYLYTKEAFHDFLSHLSPGGFLSVTRWYPQESLRLAELAAAALRERGIEDPSTRLLLVRNEAALTLIAKNGPLTEQEVSQFETAVQAAHLTLLLAARRARPSGLSGADEAHQRIVLDAGFAADPGRINLNLAPPTDDRPFFFNLVSFRAARAGKFGAPRGFVMQHGRALALLVGLLEISLVVVALFVIGPWLLRRRSSQAVPARVRLQANLYFAALGFGYLLVEIPLVQQFILSSGTRCTP